MHISHLFDNARYLVLLFRRVAHPHLNKIKVLSGIFNRVDISAGCFIIVDVWNKCYNDFYHFCKSKSAYGDFEPPHLRHMAAEAVSKVTAFYERALADPLLHLPLLQDYLTTSRCVQALLSALVIIVSLSCDGVRMDSGCEDGH